MLGIDVAISLLEKSIQRAKEDNRYYMDFIKLHKLIFLGQCYHRYIWDMDFVREDIIIREDGPYIKGLNAVAAYCGFGEIDDISELKRKVGLYFPITFLRDETCDFILDNFGMLSTMDLVRLTKNTKSYKKMITCNNNVIGREVIYQTGVDLFEKDEEVKTLKVKVKIK